MPRRQTIEVHDMQSVMFISALAQTPAEMSARATSSVRRIREKIKSAPTAQDEP